MLVARLIRRGRALARLVVDLPALWLTLRMAAWSLALPWLKRTVPLRTLVRWMWARPGAAERCPDRERHIAIMGRWLYRRDGDGRCLERSLLLYRFLSECGARPALVSGLRRDGGEWSGHAWVLVDGAPFGESAEWIERYAPTLVFSEAGRIATVPDDAHDNWLTSSD